MVLFLTLLILNKGLNNTENKIAISIKNIYFSEQSTLIMSLSTDMSAGSFHGP